MKIEVDGFEVEGVECSAGSPVRVLSVIVDSDVVGTVSRPRSAPAGMYVWTGEVQRFSNPEEVEQAGSSDDLEEALRLVATAWIRSVESDRWSKQRDAGRICQPECSCSCHAAGSIVDDGPCGPCSGRDGASS